MHRRLGLFGAFLASLVVVVGVYATIEATVREVRQHVVGPFHFLFGLNLVKLSLFAALVAAALALVSRPDFHRRLMLLATLSMLITGSFHLMGVALRAGWWLPFVAPVFS